MIRLNYSKLYGQAGVPGVHNATQLDMVDGSLFVAAVVDGNGAPWLAVRCGDLNGVVTPYLNEGQAHVFVSALRRAAAVHGWQL